jgi:hypothetical protein
MRYESYEAERLMSDYELMSVHFSECGCLRKKELFEALSQWTTDFTDKADQHG